MVQRLLPLVFLLPLIWFAGCVPMSQFAEVRDDRDTLDRDLAVLTEQAEALRLAVAEKDGQAR